MENDFNLRVYELIKFIPFGHVTTFGEIARTMGDIKLSSKIGKIIKKLPAFKEIPSHRVVDKSGKLSKENIYGGVKEQRHLLEDEGVSVVNNKVDLKKYGFYFW